MKLNEFEPIKDRALVQLLPREEKSTGGIFIPEQAQEVSQWGRLLAAGSECTLLSEIPIGTEVLVRARAGTRFVKGDMECLVIQDHDALATRVAA